MKTVSLRVLLPLVLGVVQGIAVSYSLGTLQIVSLAVFFLLLSRISGKAASFTAGLCFGTGWLSTALYWLYYSMHQYGGIPLVLSFAAVVLISAFLALSTGVAAAAARFWREKFQLSDAVYLFYALVPFWTLAAAFRNDALTGFGWGGAAYAHTDSLLFEYAPQIGSFGIDLLSSVVAASLAMTLLLLSRKAFRSAVVAFSVTLLISAGGFALGKLEYGESGGVLSFRLIQGGIAQNEKFSPMGTRQSFERYLSAMNEPGLEEGQIVVMPETIFPVPLTRLPQSIKERFLEINTKQAQPVIYGGFIEPERARYYNSAVFIDPEHREHFYLKRHLVPFGEYVPPGFRWFVDALGIPMADQQAGDRIQQPFEINGEAIGVTLCYEDLFPREMAAWWNVEKAPGVFVNLSNLAWFGDTRAGEQHLAIARMRAKEFARPMVRATNTGVTCAIDHRGRVTQVLPLMKPGYLDVKVETRRGEVTPYTRNGDFQILLFCLILIALGALRIQKKRSNG